MARNFVTRLPFLIAVALIAAALCDPGVESIANTGIFGGHYADNNHIGIIPTLLVGAMLALAVAGRRCLDVLQGSTDESRDRLFDTARAFSAGHSRADLPTVFAIQLAALFFLESTEQLVLGHRLLGGTAWLGGPILFGLVAHALGAVGCTFALRSVMRAIVRTFASFVRSVFAFVWLALRRTSSGGFESGRSRRARMRAQAPHVRQIGGRAPPLFPIPA